MTHLKCILAETRGARRPLPVGAVLAALIRDAREALAEMPPLERGVRIFWLLGPFFMLIERSPADIWLSLLVVAFLIRVAVRRQGDWLKPFWVRAFFAFWGWCIIAGAISSAPVYAATEAFIWGRFPLFAMATVFWLATDRRMLYAMLVSSALGLIVMCGILAAEIALVGQQGGRLSWPYGDLVPGNYVAKVSLPAFVVLAAVATSLKGRVGGWAALLVIGSMVISVMTGERINFLIRAASAMLAGLVWKPLWYRYLGFVLACGGVMAGLAVAWPLTGRRFIGDFAHGATDFETSSWLHTLNGGWVVARDNLLVGIGTANYRHMAPELLAGIPHTKIDPHPHNFYLQILLEGGVIGLTLGVVFLWSMIWAAFKAGLKKRENVFDAAAWIIPFGLFWPIATTANFFGQWNNCFMWSALALAMVVARKP